MNNDKNFIPKLYRTSCPLCIEAKSLLVSIGSMFEVITSWNIIQGIATSNNMTSLPILEFEEDNYLCGREVINYLKKALAK